MGFHKLCSAAGPVGAAQALALATATGDFARIQAAVLGVRGSGKDCHDSFRAEA